MADFLSKLRYPAHADIAPLGLKIPDFKQRVKIPGSAVAPPSDSTAGTGNRMGGADIANAALGVTSLIKGLTTKKPKPLSPSRFTPNIRPAQGNEEALQRTKNDIAEQVSGATRDVNRIAGSNANAGILARLGIQGNANKAISQAEGENAKLYQADQGRVSQELNQAGMINTQIDNSAKAFNAQVEQENYSATQDAAAMGVQSAIQYEANRSADNKNKYALQESNNQMIDTIRTGRWNDNYNKALIANGNDPVKAKQAADAIEAQMNLQSFRSNIYGPRK